VNDGDSPTTGEIFAGLHPTSVSMAVPHSRYSYPHREDPELRKRDGADHLSDGDAGTREPKRLESPERERIVAYHGGTDHPNGVRRCRILDLLLLSMISYLNQYTAPKVYIRKGESAGRCLRVSLPAVFTGDSSSLSSVSSCSVPHLPGLVSPPTQSTPTSPRLRPLPVPPRRPPKAPGQIPPEPPRVTRTPQPRPPEVLSGGQPPLKSSILLILSS
jgi:hypothetical protein